MQAPVQTLTHTAQLSGPTGKGHAGQCPKVIARFGSAHFIQAGERSERPPITGCGAGPRPSPLTRSPPHSQGSSQRPISAPVLPPQRHPVLAYLNRQGLFSQTCTLQTVA